MELARFGKKGRAARDSMLDAGLGADIAVGASLVAAQSRHCGVDHRATTVRLEPLTGMWYAWRCCSANWGSPPFTASGSGVDDWTCCCSVSVCQLGNALWVAALQVVLPSQGPPISTTAASRSVNAPSSTTLLG